MSPSGASRRPGSRRPSSPRAQRSRVARPTRREDRTEADRVGRQTALTARAAILVLAVASVMVAVALPLKIWLGQRGDIAQLTTQTRETEARLAQLNAEHKRWHDPGYVESQARDRLHLVVPGQKTYVVLGKGHNTRSTTTRHTTAAASGPWYSQFWQSEQAAGAATSSK
jgi:cell division protein FtsB